MNPLLITGIRPFCCSRNLLLGIVGLLAALVPHAEAVPIAAWDFTNDNTAVLTSSAALFDNHLDSADTVTRGSTAGAYAANHSFRTTGFKNDGIAIANSDYFQITLSAAAGLSLSLATLDASFFGTDTFRAATGVAGQFAYSLNGSTFALIGKVLR